LKEGGLIMSLTEFAKKNGIKQFLICFTDLCGVMRSKLVPAAAIGGMEKNGAGFAGFAAYLDMTPADADIFAMPDASAVIQLPWQKEIAWVPADLHMNGAPLKQAPRNALKAVKAQIEKLGYQFKTGVECEFFLLDPDSHQVSDPDDTREKPCYDQQVLFRHYKVISRISDYMQILGWNPYQADHEDANGQYEMNWDYTDCLQTADRHNFFKFMVRSVAEQEGYRATFMPKPFSGLTGNGCHTHMSLWNKAGQNVFEDANGELGLSETAYHFLGGILHSARALCAITNPTVNSYRRIHAAPTISGASWTPNTVSYAGNNRTHMVRIPDSDRLEIRQPDGAANPYLLQASLLAAGLDGLENKRNPGKRQDSNSYQTSAKNLKYLPHTLKEALQDLQESAILKSYLGDDIISAYLTIKQREWASYTAQVSDWEIARYVDL
jgi:glutamine synthetase